MAQEVFKRPRNLLRSESIVVGAAAVGLTPAVYDDSANTKAWADMGSKRMKARCAIVTVDNANSIRYTTDGSVPGALKELVATNGQIFLPTYQSICQFQAIQDSAASNILVNYFGSLRA